MQNTPANIITVDEFQNQAEQIVSDIANYTDPVVITKDGHPAAILVSAEEYDQMLEGLERYKNLKLTD